MGLGLGFGFGFGLRLGLGLGFGLGLGLERVVNHAWRVEELDASEVVRSEHEATVVGAVRRVDVAAVGAVRPHAEYREAEDA